LIEKWKSTVQNGLEAFFSGKPYNPCKLGNTGYTDKNENIMIWGLEMLKKFNRKR